ncbi:hypothetical protein TOPH_09102 [Tolypocladium ophioglossoides CBS 100239]|uniref:Uncharacterized protein n=1 Tax=Tolypocladium ophioglossoides (strain CBS 100239) TaxID=1163406 RepID=A0A0L0MWW8_TOLOC|nr:hypothetical protein TOPH_09102 [Tolypocladium ophioglossoides CBS 100239]
MAGTSDSEHGRCTTRLICVAETYDIMATHRSISAYDTQRKQYYCGRWYGVDGNRGEYMFPVDAEEADSLDTFHKFFLVARNDCLFSSPLDLGRQLRVLDLGTGTGIWAIELAEKYPHLIVQGIDFNMIQPEMIPPAMRPPLELDIENPWDDIDCD